MNPQDTPLIEGPKDDEEDSTVQPPPADEDKTPTASQVYIHTY